LISADIRYCCFLIPACSYLGVIAVQALQLRWGLALAVGVLAFQTTLVHWVIGDPLPSGTYNVPLRSTLVTYLGELVTPPPSPFRLAADWLNANAREGETATVVPEYAVYPLMFHARKIHYAWQFTEEKAAMFPRLREVDIRGHVPPRYAIVFSAFTRDEAVLWKALDDRGAHYEKAATFPVTGVDQTRAELFWHRFDADDAFRAKASLTIWRRVD
jgi:hypothetical protein